MLIIFDLDDTLIDTSGSVTPFKLRLCLKKMVDLGCRVQSFAEAEKELFELNQKSLRSKDAVLEFLFRYSFSLELVETVLSELSSPLPDDFLIPTTPGAKEILEFFKNRPVALVTGGSFTFQTQKMEKAGIEPSLFCKIEIPGNCVKKPIYEVLLREFSALPSNVWVCGDRVEMDLIPAKDLGMRTIQMCWGRGTLQKEKNWGVDYQISDLRELKGIIQ